jgi:hypothetical protein
MSICLDVIPSTNRVPTAGELVSEIEERLKVLSENAVVERTWDRDDVSPKDILVELLDELPNDEARRHSDPSLPLSMGGHDYGWLSADNYGMGFDFYYTEHVGSGEFYNVFISEDMAVEAAARDVLQDFSFDRASKVGHHWMLRGQAGRSRATWLLAGITAAALAKLTDGIIYSDDGGADYAKMPEGPDAFLDWFPDWCYKQWGY